MFVHHQSGVVLAPDVEHGTIYNICQAPLRVISNRLAEDVRVVTSTHEPTFASSERNQVTCSSESGINICLPLLVPRESSKVLWLEGDDDVDGEAIGFGDCVWLSSV